MMSIVPHRACLDGNELLHYAAIVYGAAIQLVTAQIVPAETRERLSDFGDTHVKASLD